MPINVATDDLVKYLNALGLTCGLGGTRSPVQPKTGNYTVDIAFDPSESVFTNEGAVGAVVFTLPAPTVNLKGMAYNFHGVADQNITVSAGAGLGIAFNNAACASLAASTAGQKIGARIRAVCTGAKWLLTGENVGHTYTVA